MLGADPYPSQFSMGPWANGPGISPWSHPCDASAVTAATVAASFDPMGAWSDPWVQPYHEEIERLQQQVEDLKLWKLQAEESMRAQAFHQAAIEACNFSGYAQPPLASELWLSAGAMKAVAEVPEPTVKAIEQGHRCGGGASPLSLLPMPLRVELGGPEPAAPSRSPSAREATELSRHLSPGVVLPPGLTLAMVASLPVDVAETRAALGAASLPRSPSEPSSQGTPSVATSEAPPGMWIGPVQVAGMGSMRAEWRIDDLRARLQACMGRPLVSPPFAVCGLPNLRLMVFPDAREAVKSARSRERKGMYAAMVKKGPLHGALKLKADCLPLPTVLRFNLTVGGTRKGPFTYDFSEQAIHGCDDFSVDWLRQVDDGTDNLRVGVEILEIRENRGLNSIAPEGKSPQELYSLALRQLELSGAA